MFPSVGSALHGSFMVNCRAKVKCHCIFLRFMFSRQNLQGKGIRRTASIRSRPYGQEEPIEEVDNVGSMEHQVRSTVRLSELQSWSSSINNLQGALNALCGTDCARLLHAHVYRYYCVCALMQVVEELEEEYTTPRKRSASNSSNKSAPALTGIVDKVCVFACVCHHHHHTTI
jgi:hypothetical protein